MSRYDTISVSDAGRKIGFDSGLPGSTSTVYVLPVGGSCSSPVAGSTCTWPAASVVGRDYGIEVRLDLGKQTVRIKQKCKILLYEKHFTVSSNALCKIII